MGNQKKETRLYDPSTGANLLTAQEAARYLKYHPVSIRRLVSRGDLRPHTRAGKTLLFLRAELDRFKLGNPWASRKAKVKVWPNPPQMPYRHKTMTAVVTKGGRGRPRVIERIRSFHWEDIPLIRARVDRRFGNVHFQISVQSPDGAGWELFFYSNSLELKQHPEPNRAKRGRAEAWLVG